MVYNYKKFSLENGITLICEEVPFVESATVGVWVKAGSIFEEEDENGISHFIEHLIFKGTEKRSAREISETIEGLGGELNGFTGKEYACYYIKLPSRHLEVAIELLSDITNNSVFRNEDVLMERHVICEEIARYYDTPDDEIHDLFIQSCLNNHPLGRPIIGKKEIILKVLREKLLEIYKSLYTPKRIVISISGNTSFKKASKWVFKYFSKNNGKDLEKEIVKPKIKGGIINKEKETEQVHFCIGTRGLPATSEKRFVLSILNTILGGGMSSRLFYQLREKRGLCYAIYSYPQSFKECGLFTVYCGTSPKNYRKVVRLIINEFKKIKNNLCLEKEVNRAKEQLKGALILSLENTANRMERLAKQELYFKRQFSLEEIIAMIDSVSIKDIQDLANIMFEKDFLSLALIGQIRKEEISLDYDIL